MAISNQLKSLVSLSTLNTSIALATIALEQIFNIVVFKCPCISNSFSSLNFMYGSVFLAVPAIVLLVIGYAMNPKTWRFFTGYCQQRKSAKKCCRTFFVILLRALVAPLSWISIAFLDGGFYACAMTSRPYNQSCEDVNSGRQVLIYSAEYHKHLAVSRLIGWFTIAGCFIFGAVAYTTHRCCLRTDHWRYEHFEWTKKIREDIFEKKVKEQIEKKANEDIQKYSEEERPEAIFKYFGEVMTDKKKDLDADEMELLTVNSKADNLET